MAAAVADRFLKDIQQKRSLDPKSVVQLVKDVSRLASNKEEALEALRLIAKGADGVSGTRDDIIPPATLKTVLMLMESGVLEELVVELRGGCGWCSCFQG